MQMTAPLKVLGICGSLRKSSTNLSILKYIAAKAPDLGIDFTIADLSQVPLLNPDTNKDDKPAAVQTLLSQYEAADAFVLACPEYNYSMAPALKNALDWGSIMPNNQGFKGKAAAVVSAGGGMRGSRAQYHLRQVAVFLDLHMVNKPEVQLSAFDGTAFEKDSNALVGEHAQDLVLRQMKALKELAAQVSPKSAV